MGPGFVDSIPFSAIRFRREPAGTHVLADFPMSDPLDAAIRFFFVSRVPKTYACSMASGAILSRHAVAFAHCDDEPGGAAR